MEIIDTQFLLLFTLIKKKGVIKQWLLDNPCKQKPKNSVWTNHVLLIYFDRVLSYNIYQKQISGIVMTKTILLKTCSCLTKPIVYHIHVSCKVRKRTSIENSR